jgi:hypothetical protein
LPLALGEAALTGAPVVCTDVGASLSVLTDSEKGECFSGVVAPNDARALARAQIKILAMIEEWEPYSQNPDTAHSGEDLIASVAPKLLDCPSASDIQKITQRMYNQTPARRALGMRARDIVQKSFGGERYLREHEQMLWVGKTQNDWRNKTSISAASPSSKRSSNSSNKTAAASQIESSRLTQLTVVEAEQNGTKNLVKTLYPQSVCSTAMGYGHTTASSAIVAGIAEQHPLQQLKAVRVKVTPVDLGVDRLASDVSLERYQKKTIGRTPIEIAMGPQMV